MSENRFARQLDIIPPEKLAALDVTVIGCGAVGSFTCLTLAKMGVTKLTVYDGDKVAEHNLPNQWYRPDHVGMNKTDALWDVLVDFTGVEMKAHDYHYTREKLSGVVIGAVDSMDTRLKIWKQVLHYQPALYLDARMGAEVGKILVAHPADPLSVKKYEEELYPSSAAFHAPCTAKATMYCACGLAAFVGAMVAGYTMGRRLDSLVVDWRTFNMVGG
jgi:glycine/D-amino acid oxidase-like deaminating enzyme